MRTRSVARSVSLALCVAVVAAGGLSASSVAARPVGSAPANVDTRLPAWSPYGGTRLTSGLPFGPVWKPSGLLDPSEAQSAAAACTTGSNVICSQVVVPLDRTGKVPGTISLHVETLPAVGPERGVMFLIAGGPGQGSARAFSLSSASAVLQYRYLFPGYRLVAFDNRGTGASGLLTCPGLQTSTDVQDEAALGAACATQIGPTRDFYSTHDHADDIESVRQSIGADKIGLWGTSYGTKLAVAYALAQPSHVERLVLDSVVQPDLDDPFRANTLREMPKALAGYCAGGVCRSATTDFAGDVITVANRLGTKAVSGTVLQSNGKRRTMRMRGVDLLGLVVDSDLNPGLAAQLPAAVHAARGGDPSALLRLYRFDQLSSAESPEDLSFALFAATVCADGPFPWTSGTALVDRPAQLRAAIASLPAGTLGPFGTWAIALGNANLCLGWPNPAVPTPPLGPGPLPDVPMLAISGSYDMRTPTSSAIAITSRFPQGRLLVVPAVGHSVLGADLSFCSSTAVRNWILTNAAPAHCARPDFIVSPIGAYPAKRKPARVASPAATLAIANRTISEASAVWLMTLQGASGSVPGLTSGRIVGEEGLSFRLVRYGIAPGIEVSGELQRTGSGLPLTFEGFLRVTGARASTGIVGVSHGKVAGTLGGRIVSAKTQP